MRRYPTRDQSNPANLLDDGPSDPEPSKPRQSRAKKDRPRHQDQPRPNKHTRPEEVSENVWGLSEQWLELGAAHYGKRPPVNRQEFSKRLSARINSDKTLRRWMRPLPEKIKASGEWESGTDVVTDIMVRAMEMFFGHLTVEQTNTSALQFAFLDEEWDEWIYHAETSVKVRWYKKFGTWEKPSLPNAVFDPRTVGEPADDAPCTDPLYPGMTWGDVRALDESHLLSPRSDEPVPEPEHELRPELARFRRAIVAKRKTTTKETTDD